MDRTLNDGWFDLSLTEQMFQGKKQAGDCLILGFVFVMVFEAFGCKFDVRLKFCGTFVCMKIC